MSVISMRVYTYQLMMRASDYEVYTSRSVGLCAKLRMNIYICPYVALQDTPYCKLSLCNLD